MSDRMQGRAAVVTGAARGIGREIARRLASEGASVLVNDVDGDELAEVASDIRKAGGTVATSTASIASFAGGATVVDACIAAFGAIHVLVNNAGVLRDRMVFKLSEEEWLQALAVNLTGQAATIRAATPHMKAQGWGRIVNMTSRSGLLGNVGQAAYGAAKAGVVGLTLCVARDMARYGVTVNAVSPSARTRLTEGVLDASGSAQAPAEVLRWEPEDVAPLVAYLCTEAAGYITGQVLGVRGGAVYVWSQPEPVRMAYSRGGWSIDDLDLLFRDALCEDGHVFSQVAAIRREGSR